MAGDGEIKNVSVFVASDVSQDDCREIIDAAENMKKIVRAVALMLNVTYFQESKEDTYEKNEAGIQKAEGHEFGESRTKD